MNRRCRGGGCGAWVISGVTAVGFRGREIRDRVVLGTVGIRGRWCDDNRSERTLR